jgi:ATP-binding cassette subfamily C protein LapB
MGKHVNDTQLMHVIKTLGLDSVSDKNEKGIDMPISEGGSGLSGGQKQLVGLGRLFLNGPAVWLLDEPTASLDPNRQSTIKKALSDQIGANDILVFATHNPKFAVEVATRIIVMENGKIIKDVPTSEVELRAANG